MVKMRNNKDTNAVCSECGDIHDKVLEMYDLCIAGQVFTICDRCNGILLSKTLKAECANNERLKTKKDLDIISRRRKNVATK